MIDSVTHNDKVIVTNGGQQTGPTLIIDHGGGEQLIFVTSKGKCSPVSRKFSTILYLLN